MADGPPQTDKADLSIRLDFVRQIHAAAIEHIKLADTKAGLVAAAAAALFNVIALRAREDIPALLVGADTGQQASLTLLRGATLVVAVVALALALAFSYATLRPRIAPQVTWAAFIELARAGPAGFLARVEQEPPAELLATLAQDAANISGVAAYKHQMVRRAIFPLVAGAIAVGLLLLLS